MIYLFFINRDLQTEKKHGDECPTTAGFGGIIYTLFAFIVLWVSSPGPANWLFFLLSSARNFRIGVGSGGYTNLGEYNCLKKNPDNDQPNTCKQSAHYDFSFFSFLAFPLSCLMFS